MGLRWSSLLLVACSSAASPALGTGAPAVISHASPPATADSDHDGVPDACDRCPREPGVDRADHPYGRGCPWLDAFGEPNAYLQPPIAFRKGSAALDRSLASLALEMKRHTGERFFVVGNASTDEPDPEALAIARARAVADALAAAGVDPASIEVHSAGATRPEYDPGIGPNLAQSRRVVLDVSRDHSRNRAWLEDRREVDYIPYPDLCAPQIK